MKLKVLSYNIHKGFDHWGRFSLEAMRAALHETHADLVFLQEVVGENKSLLEHFKLHAPNERQFEYLADSLWPHFSYGKNAVFPDRHHGNAILSKYPIVSSHNLDLSTNNYESRGMLHAQIDIVPESHSLHVFNTHLNLLAGSRMRQMGKIIDWIKTQLSSEHSFLLAGDFNDWNQGLSDPLKTHLTALESFDHLHGGHAQSFPAFWPKLCLDRIYFRGLRVNSAKVLKGSPWSELSDHLPLLAEFETH